MTLRRRLTLLIALAVVVPIAAVGLTTVNLVSSEVDQRRIDRLDQAARFLASAVGERAVDVEREAEVTAEALTAARTGAGQADLVLRQALELGDLDVAVVGDGAGGVVAGARREPRFLPGTEVPDAAALLAGRGRDLALLSRHQLDGDQVLVAGRWLDQGFVNTLPRTDDVGLAVVAGGQELAATGGATELPGAEATGGGDGGADDGGALVAPVEVPGTASRVITVVRPPVATDRTDLVVVLAILLVLVLVLVVLIGHVVAGLVTRPISELVGAANAVARGDLDQRVEVQGDVEVAALGRAFNQMTENLRDQVRQLEQSRTEFRRAIARLGDALASTHDLDGIITVVLEACSLTLGAERAVFYERVAMPARIRPRTAHGGRAPTGELNGTGVAGTAGRRVTPVVHPGPESLDPEEPQAASAAAVPVVWDGRLFGVLAVYGRRGGGEFRAEDVDTLQTLARQAEVAIGNVMLHQEARQQARTDGLTGLWNRREFELRAQDAIREAQRFGEPFGVVLLDLDNFKAVNDRYDHLTGDAALVWVAAHLDEATREVDLVARWGGEEFIVLLPRAGVEETAMVAERIRRAVAQDPMEHDGAVIPLTVSVGFACHPDDGLSTDALFRAADSALLRAKRHGKNRVERAYESEGAA